MMGRKRKPNMKITQKGKKARVVDDSDESDFVDESLSHIPRESKESDSRGSCFEEEDSLVVKAPKTGKGRGSRRRGCTKMSRQATSHGEKQRHAKLKITADVIRGFDITPEGNAKTSGQEHMKKSPDINCRVETFGRILTNLKLDSLKKRWVYEMGFGELFHLEGKQLPRQFCYWILTGLDPIRKLLSVTLSPSLYHPRSTLDLFLPQLRRHRLNSSDVAAHRKIIDTTDRLTSENKLPLQLLCGPPRTGETSTILAVASKY